MRDHEKETKALENAIEECKKAISSGEADSESDAVEPKKEPEEV